MRGANSRVGVAARDNNLEPPQKVTVTELRWLPGRGVLTGTTADFTRGGQGFPGAVQPINKPTRKQ